jgi:hypothetical protein
MPSWHLHDRQRWKERQRDREHSETAGVKLWAKEAVGALGVGKGVCLGSLGSLF